MHRVVTLVLVAFSLSFNANAQEQPKFEVFGGYSLERIAPCGTGAGGCGYQEGSPFHVSNFNGWNAALTGHVYKSVGLTADFGGHYSALAAAVNVHRYSYLFGPVYTFRSEKTSAFVHALFGGVSQGGNEVATSTSFTWAVGGGIDVNLSHHLSLRPVQLDYERSHVPTFPSSISLWANGFRYSGGVVFRF